MELLIKGHRVLIDDEDWDLVKGYSWSIVGSGSGVFYARAWTSRAAGKKRSVVWMHRLIHQTPPGAITDHRNGNGLDNRKANLRTATKGQNRANDKTVRRFKGVSKRPDRETTSKPWRARIEVEGRRTHLGYFATEEEAARAYDAAALEAWGEFARLNFPQAKAA